MERKASAVWQGNLKGGKGTISTASGALSNTQYSFSSRFESGVGTNPEELIAAAHAGCFTMKLSFVLGESNFTPTSIETICTVDLENGAITSSHLVVKASVPGITPDAFQKCADNAKANCPISKALNTNIS